jgi:amino acid transporter
VATARTDPRTVSLPLVVGFAVVATGGPLALVALFVPTTVGASSSMGLLSVLAAAVFVVPVAVWYRYSRHIASSGGLFAFVEAAAGRRLALVQAAIWIISYFLYLPYTIVYIVYDVLPAVFPGIGWGRTLLEIVLPLAIAALALLRVRSALVVVGILALAQLALLVVLVVAGTAHLGVSGAAFGAQGPVHRLASNTANVSLLYVCVSLPVYLGGETVGGGPTLSRGLVTGFGLSALFVVLGALLWTRAGSALLGSEIPGVTLAREAWGHGFEVAVGVGVAASVAGVIVAEYFALGRLVSAISGWQIRPAMLAVAGGFLVTSALALIDPQGFYDQLLKPSLVALWVSQIPVFVVYPRFVGRRGRLGPLAVILAGAATALVGYGLYEAVKAATG